LVQQYKNNQYTFIFLFYFIMTLCGLEIPLAIVSCVAAVAGAITAVSEMLPFFKKISGNGLVHSVYHLIYKPEACELTPSPTI